MKNQYRLSQTGRATDLAFASVAGAVAGGLVALPGAEPHAIAIALSVVFLASCLSSLSSRTLIPAGTENRQKDGDPHYDRRAGEPLEKAVKDEDQDSRDP
jgi:hypothetical protein